MKIKISLSIILVWTLLTTGSGAVYAAEEVVDTNTGEQRLMSEDEMVDRLNSILKYNAELLPSIPGLIQREGPAGVFYEYNGTRLEDLNREVLSSILRNVNQQVSYKSYLKLQRDLKAIKQIDDFNKMQRMLRQLKNPIPEVPKVYTPPKPVNPPKPYEPPKIPKAPKTYNPNKNRY